MKKKNITTDDLAEMVQKGFKEVDEKLKRGFGEVDEKLENKFNSLENEMKIIRKHQIAHTIYRDEFEILETRVKYLENILNLHPKN